MHYDLIHIGAGVREGDGDRFTEFSRHSIAKALLVDPDREALMEAVEVCKPQSDDWEWCDKIVVPTGYDAGLVSMFAPVRDGHEMRERGTMVMGMAQKQDHDSIIEWKARPIQIKELVNDFCVTSADRLVVDCEGADTEIVGGFLDLNIIPRIVIWEYPWSGGKRITLADRMSAMGYIHSTLDDLNRLSVLNQ